MLDDALIQIGDGLRSNKAQGEQIIRKFPLAITLLGKIPTGKIR